MIIIIIAVLVILLLILALSLKCIVTLTDEQKALEDAEQEKYLRDMQVNRYKNN